MHLLRNWMGVLRTRAHAIAKITGRTRLTDWAREHASTLGVRYESELARQQKRGQARKNIP